MNKRDRIEQQRIAMKAIRTAMRRWAKARRGVHSARHSDLSSYAIDDLRRTASDAHSEVLAMRSLAADLGIVDYFGPVDRRAGLILEASITRRPFRHLKTVSA